MATESSILAWKISRTEEPVGLQSMGSQNRTQLNMHICAHTHTHFLNNCSVALAVAPLLSKDTGHYTMEKLSCIIAHILQLNFILGPLGSTALDAVDS